MFYIFKDGMIQARTATKKAAIELIRAYQARETHPFLRAQFSIIEGTEEFIPYKKANTHKEKRRPERQEDTI
jgi:hypothetical protein